MKGNGKGNGRAVSYAAWLNATVDRIFDEASELDFTLKKMAERSKLGYSTVCRIDNRKTKLPRLKTVLSLARAVGMDLELVERVALHKGNVA